MTAWSFIDITKKEINGCCPMNMGEEVGMECMQMRSHVYRRHFSQN